MGWLLFFVALAFLYYQHRVHAVTKSNLRKERDDNATAANRLSAENDGLKKSVGELTGRIEGLLADVAALSAFSEIRDLAVEAERIREEARTIMEVASREANAARQQSRLDAAEASRKSIAFLDQATAKAAAIMAKAELDAQATAGEAFRALREFEEIRRAAAAIENTIEGYGDRYLVPSYSVLDELADSYSFEEAGRDLKLARELTKRLIATGGAATCDYAEAVRRTTAIHFVLDAFNGKVDTILSRVKSDNVGTLRQQIKDAYAVVNNNGKAFRNARITAEYFASRLEELRWAAAAMALRERDKEEQRRAREQIREEEKAQREIDRALREAEREEQALQRAMQRVQQQFEKANEEQRTILEAQLADLRSRLSEAEAKNQRALSMAQQTRAGHVYVISNIGSFGDDIFKVGMTRRLEPQDRVRELGDASVPFSFDVHAMIWSDDAPALEHALHKRFVTAQVNKVNPRKEFFRVPLSELRGCVEEMGLRATWTLAADAAQFRETLAIERSLAAGTTEAQDWLRAQMAFEPDIPAEELSEVLAASGEAEPNTARLDIV